MFDLGFIPKTFRNGLAQFAADFDIPGIGRGTVGQMLPESDPSAAEEAAATGTAAPTAAEAAAGPGVKTFATVAEEARTALDASLASLAKAGKPASLSDPQQADALFGAFDRRSLFAVASNSGGKFSKEEQKAAQSVMARQQEQAMKAADPTGSNPAAAYRAGVLFLDQAGEEEKASAGWSVQRAAAQFGYESAMRRKGAEPDRLESGSDLVRMLKGALDTSKDMEAKGLSGADYVQKLLKMPAFRDGVPDLNDYLKNAVSLKV
ncbi:hypothetical protein DEW08_11300 [Azospirillum thermophilum]|uniref:Uncharacterized protein n=2 Tax=Azospirillum thermophilum TaxID=2202148 RepID=A0A2S2CTX2_9PROT|nr:hypothetical protein DEW08_11300 [Azospirillum thermophilum]